MRIEAQLVNDYPLIQSPSHPWETGELTAHQLRSSAAWMDSVAELLVGMRQLRGSLLPRPAALAPSRLWSCLDGVKVKCKKKLNHLHNVLNVVEK